MVEGSEQEIQQVVKALKGNRFETVIVVKNKEEAVKKVLEMVPENASVGTGGSMTVNQTGLREILIERGNIKPFVPGQALNNGRPPSPDVFLTSSNAVTLNGKLVNIDSTGNRVSQQIYGPGKVIIVISQNKIATDEAEAVERVQQVISPFHGQTMGIDAPCAKDAKCHDCKSPGRICNITTIIRKKPRTTDLCIVLVAEDLGLGWDPGWPEERIAAIKKNYRNQWQIEMDRFRRPK
ncbi:MAG: lactate utilization protein [Dehalococcoidales bacterium]|nr:lactate utilization protein [Dehalococcoidales bacterium]